MTEEEKNQKAREALADLFFDDYDDDDDPKITQTLNMNDVWCWASADGQYVPDDKLQEVAKLYEDYGWCGIVYWVSEQNNGMKSEFYDINRFIEFVRQEEQLKKKIPSSSKRAYKHLVYKLGTKHWFWW